MASLPGHETSFRSTFLWCQASTSSPSQAYPGTHPSSRQTLPTGSPVRPSDILRAPCLQNSAPAFSLLACWVQSVMLHWLLTLFPSSTVRMKDPAAVASTWRHLQTVVCKDPGEACDSAHSSPWVWLFLYQVSRAGLYGWSWDHT